MKLKNIFEIYVSFQALNLPYQAEHLFVHQNLRSVQRGSTPSDL